MAPAPDATSTAPLRVLALPFRVVLSTHDDEPPAPADPPAADPPADPIPGLESDPAPADPPADPGTEPGDKPLGPAGEKALREMKLKLREAERSAKANAAAAARLREIEDAQKTETERLAEAKQAAEQRAAAAEQRAVAAEIRALATDRFADPADAVEALSRDGAAFVGPDGTIDDAAIRDALDGLLDRKPHWAKPTATPAPTAPPAPRPDPSQGSRTPPPPVDFTTASPEEFRAEAAKLGIRLP